ncbi:Beta-L-arabinobiosidase [Pseudocercospora fuligena]|uniref:Beta-L-arabinobiosidase n=1 Tax=Pseudocercospora fuligena TaxID=685502 RepID=A0A8H6RL11_9PEZI|nr:Beta-L-arabinobiosidase [Pseudocercospora fuligena]
MPLLAVLLALVTHFRPSSAQGPPSPRNANLTGTNLLDHDAPIASYFGKSFLKENIPYIDLPDKTIKDVYYYRFTALQRHLLYATAGTGYVITEFYSGSVGYAGAFSTINAAAGHQLEEARWLQSAWYSEDFTQIWTRGPGYSNQYTQWIQFAAVGAANVTGNSAFIGSQLGGLLRMWHEWDSVFDSSVGLYYYTPEFDAQEHSLPGYIADAALGGGNPDNIIYHGPNTYRPSHNAYMVANAEAIVTVANALGNVSLAQEYTRKADALKQSMVTHLWNESQAFFVDNIKSGEPGAGQVDGREEVGFFPFRFGIALSDNYTNSTIHALYDKDIFNTTHAPPTLEVHNPYFNATISGCCWWNGQNWPYSTAHTIQSLAAIHRMGGGGGLTADQYIELLHNYALTQYKNGKPYVAESHYPEQDGWSQDSPNHSEHYMHSTYINNVITGIIGIMPRADSTLELSPIIPDSWSYFALENVAYHGMLLTILYDKDGSKYNNGLGLTVFANDEKIHNGPDLKVNIPLPDTNESANDSPIEVNIAANPLGSDGWPKASATFTWQDNDVNQANDGTLYYDEVPTNRWSNYQEHLNPSDTLTIYLQRPRNVTGVVLAIFDDTRQKPNGAVAIPAAIEITGGAGKLLANESEFASHGLANDINVVSFNGTMEIYTLHIKFTGQPGKAVGVSEVQIWLPANIGPFYFAADALPDSAAIAFDEDSKATPNGTVIATRNSTSSIAFSGIYAKEVGRVEGMLRYKNNATKEVELDVTVNRILNSTVTLPVTGNVYESVDMPLTLWRGTNFVTLRGGADGVFVEGVEIS